MIFIKLFLCLAIFVTFGRLTRKVVGDPGRKSTTDMESLFLYLVVGFGAASLILFALASLGWFHGPGILIVFAGVGLALVAAGTFRSIRASEMGPMLSLAAVVAALGFLLYQYAGPYQAISYGADGSVYCAAAESLAHSGKLSYQDPLVLEMSPAQREAFFRNRFREDWTGPYFRFPGGVKLTDPTSGTVHFSFYHMLPVWLAFSMKVFGPDDYFVWLSVISALLILSLFFLGKRLAGTPAALMAPAALFLFYPYQYVSRFPLSETLTGMLFLSGLLSLVCSLEEKEQAEPPEMRRTGVLWSSAILCRIDCLYVITLFLLLSLTILPRFARNRGAWLPLLRVLGISVLAGIYSQVVAGEYISLFTNSENLRAGAITDLGLQCITWLHLFVNHYDTVSFVIFVGLCSGIAMVPAWKGAVTPKYNPLFASLGLLISLVMLAPVTGAPPILLDFLAHLRWFFPYAPAPWFAVLLAGAVYFGATRGNQPGALVCVTFFILALAVYLFRPLIIPEQPWFMRRFIPILIPLFLVLGFSGLYRLFETGCRLKPLVGGVLFCAASLSSFILLYSKTEYLFDEPLYRGAVRQNDALASRLPSGALVLIPDTVAGLHLQLPLKYRHGIDTLVLPLETRSGRRLSPTVRSYLDAQAIRRPVVVLSNEGTDAVYPLWQFYCPSKMDSIPFSILFVPKTSQYEYPPRATLLNFSVSLFRLYPSPGVPVPRKNLLSYDDPAITFLRFHEKEKGFRWTRDTSTLTDFSFPTGGRMTDLLLELKLVPEDFNPNDVSVRVNYTVPADLVAFESTRLRFRIPAGSVQEIRSVQIHTRTFRERPGPEARDLGVCFEKLTITHSEDEKAPTSSSD